MPADPRRLGQSDAFNHPVVPGHASRTEISNTIRDERQQDLDGDSEGEQQ